MADLGFNFNSQDTAPSAGFDAVPAGEYVAAVTESALKPNKAGTGKVIHLTHEILDGQFKGRKFWNYINIINPNKQCQDIGRGEFSALCRACGKVDVQDTSVLHSIPIKVNVGIELDQKGLPRNIVKGYVWKDSQVSAENPSAASGVTDVDCPF